MKFVASLPLIFCLNIQLAFRYYYSPVALGNQTLFVKSNITSVLYVRYFRIRTSIILSSKILKKISHFRGYIVINICVPYGITFLSICQYFKISKKCRCFLAARTSTRTKFGLQWRRIEILEESSRLHLTSLFSSCKARGSRRSSRSRVTQKITNLEICLGPEVVGFATIRGKISQPLYIIPAAHTTAHRRAHMCAHICILCIYKTPYFIFILY